MRACTVEKAAGHRIILSAKTIWLSDIPKTLHDEFSPQGFKIPFAEANYFFIRLASWISSEANQVRQAWGKEYVFDTSVSTDILGLEYGDPNVAIIETANTMLAQGLIQKPAVGRRGRATSGYSKTPRYTKGKKLDRLGSEIATPRRRNTLQLELPI